MEEAGEKLRFFFFISYSLVSSMVFVRIVYATCSARSVVQLR